MDVQVRNNSRNDTRRTGTGSKRRKRILQKVAETTIIDGRTDEGGNENTKNVKVKLYKSNNKGVFENEVSLHRVQEFKRKHNRFRNSKRNR